MDEQQFERWAGTFALAVDDMPDGIMAVIGADKDAETVEIVGFEPEEDTAVVAASDQLFASRRSVAMMATAVSWSPTQEGESSPAWSLVVVDRRVQSFFAVRRLKEDDAWWRLTPTDVPWFMLSTASSLRAMMRGEPMALKRAGEHSEDLFKRPVDAPNPKTDEQGRL